MIATLILFTSLTCSNCVIAKQELKASCIKYKEVQISSAINQYGITAVPVLELPDTTRLVGSYEIEGYAKTHNQCKR